LCALNAEYRNASDEERIKMRKRCRTNRDAKRAQTPKRKAAMRMAALKHDVKRSRLPDRAKSKRAADAKRSGTTKRKESKRAADAKRSDSTKREKIHRAAEAKRSGTTKRKEILRAADAKRSGTTKRKEILRAADAKRSGTTKRKATKRTADAKRSGTEKRKMSRKIWKKQNACDTISRDIAKESQVYGIYSANSRKFVSCAAANIAKQVASRVNMNEEDVKRILTPLSDSEILRIKQQWDAHMTMNSNSQTCSTCGIIGLAHPREYPLENPCINAFKVMDLNDFCSCIFLRRATVPFAYAGVCWHMHGRERSCLLVCEMQWA